MNTRTSLCVATLAAAAGLTAACQSSRPPITTLPPVAVTPSTAGGSPGLGRADPPPSPTATRATDPVGPPECKLATGLTVTPGRTDATSGHRALVLVFTNGGSAECILIGYPGVDALDGAGTSVAHARRTTAGYEGGITGSHPTPVTLAPGGSASAIVEALAFGSGGSSCTAYAGLLVTAPDDTQSTPVAWAGTDACANLEVHPVVSGNQG
jgi:hypothetical protein